MYTASQENRALSVTIAIYSILVVQCRSILYVPKYYFANLLLKSKKTMYQKLRNETGHPKCCIMMQIEITGTKMYSATKVLDTLALSKSDY